MDLTDFAFDVAHDIEFLMYSEGCTLDELALSTGVSRPSLIAARKGKSLDYDVLEKIYSFAYARGYRLNSVKEELLNESSSEKVLFHGSRYGLGNVSANESRKNSDFGHGLYLSEAYKHALAFVCEAPRASVYSFTCNLENLEIEKFTTSLEWMLAICCYRGKLKTWKDSEKVRKIVERVENADVVIAPIADNRMFSIMNSFASGDINADVAIHSLSASKLGMQYILKTENAISALTPVERYYISEGEKRNCNIGLIERSAEINTKLKLAKREFRTGLYIEEILK